MRLFAPLDRGRRAQDIVGAHPLAFAGQRIAAARAANSLEDAVANQRLQHRLQVPRRQSMPQCQRLGGNRTCMRLQRHVDDGGNG